MTRIKVSKIWKAKESIAKLYKSDIPVKKAFKAKNTLAKIDAILKNYTDTFNEIVEKIGVRTDKGYTVPGISEEECKKVGWTLDQAIDANKRLKEDVNTLGNQEVDINIVKISLDELYEGTSLLSVSDVTLLEDFIHG